MFFCVQITTMAMRGNNGVWVPDTLYIWWHSCDIAGANGGAESHSAVSKPTATKAGEVWRRHMDGLIKVWLAIHRYYEQLSKWWSIMAVKRFILDYQPWHDDVTKWKHFPCNWPFVRGIHRFPVNSPHKGQWRRASIFSLIYVWINDWVNNREAGELRRHRAHYDVIVMK